MWEIIIGIIGIGLIILGYFIDDIRKYLRRRKEQYCLECKRRSIPKPDEQGLLFCDYCGEAFPYQLEDIR